MLRAVKRVPIPIVLLLGVAAVAIPWWQGTKDVDFVTAPSEKHLERIRYATSRAFPKREQPAPEDARKEAKAFQSPIKAAPVIHPGNPQAPAMIDAYREHAEEGAAAFVELAAHLEEQSGNPRALLAWERVIDSCQADEAQLTAAYSGIQRLRPLVAPWNIDPVAAIPLTLEASVGKEEAAGELEEDLGRCAEILNRKSSGLIQFSPRLERPATKEKKQTKVEKNEGPADAEAAEPLVSLQILADGESAASTGLIEFPLPADPDQARSALLSAAYKLVGSQIAAATVLTPPRSISAGEDPLAALGTRVTRLSWQEFGKSLVPADRP